MTNTTISRLKNPYFWIGLVGLFIATIGLDVETVTNWNILVQTLKDFISNPFLVGSFIVAFIGYIINPTTKGLKD